MSLLANPLIELETFLHLASSLHVITPHTLQHSSYYNNCGLSFCSERNVVLFFSLFCSANSFLVIDQRITGACDK